MKMSITSIMVRRSTLSGGRHSSGFIALIFVLMPLSMIGLEIHIAALPDLVAHFDSDHKTIQWSLTSYLAGYALGQPFAGILAEKYGRRPIVLASLLMYSFFSILVAFSPTAILFVMFRFLQGCMAAPVAVVSKTVINDCFRGRDHQRMSNYASVAWAAGGLAPLLGGVTAHISNWQTIFLAFGAMIFLVFVIGYFHWPETRPGARSRETSLEVIIKRILTNMTFIAAVSCMALISSFSLIFSMDAPFLIEERLNESKIAYGLSAAIMVVAWSIGPLICQYLHKQHSLKSIADSSFLICGILIFGAEIIDLWLPETLALTVASLFVVCLPGAVLFPVFLGAALRSNVEDFSALTSAFIGALFILSMSAISWLLSIFSDYRLIFITALHIPLILSCYVLYRAFLRNSVELALS